MSIQWDANDDIFSFASANVLPMNRHSYQKRNKHQQIMAKQQQNECDEKNGNKHTQMKNHETIFNANVNVNGRIRMIVV